MAPPPATPASSSKFLFSKRQQSQSQQNITPSQPGGRPKQFNATPRFSVSSTPKVASSQAPQFSTPAVVPPRLSSARSKATQDLIDIESSPELSGAESPTGHERHDVITEEDLITSFVSESTSGGYQGGRSPKRRRISISPVLESSPAAAVRPETLPELLDIDIEPSPSSEGDEEDFHDSSDVDSLLESDEEEERYDEDQPGSPTRPASTRKFLLQTGLQLPAQAQGQPSFKPPPHFKQPSASTSLPPQYPLPDAFSPQRRGAKYVNGGLAGELRDWLVDVKGLSEAADALTTTGSKAASEAEVASAGVVRVEEVSEGTGFRLMRGSDGKDRNARMVLAGEGRLSGLAERRNTVSIGCNVMILPPTWNIELERQTWTVACDCVMMSRSQQASVVQLQW